MDVSSSERWIEIEQGKLYTKTWHPAKTVGRAPLILLHDSLGSVALWRHFPEELAKTLERPILAYDRLGFGQSSERHDRPAFTFIEEEANSIFPQLIQALDLDRFLLFGHSVGGAMAFHIASAMSDRCVALISEAAQAFVEERTIRGIEEAKRSFADEGHLARLARYHGTKAKWVLDAWTEVWLSPAFANWTLEAVLPRVVCPALIIHGGKDEFGSSAFPEFISKRLQSPRETLWLPEAGHVPHKENAALVMDAIQKFLSAQTIRD